MTQPAHLNSEELVIRSYLLRAMADASGSLLMLQLVQRLAMETPGPFLNAALSLLGVSSGTECHRLMIGKLIEQPQLMRVLADPQRANRPAAIRRFRLIMQYDRNLDVRLAQALPDRYGRSDQSFPVEFCERALEILDDVSEGRRIVPILQHLVDHPVARIASKATLLIGRRVQSEAWARRLLGADRNRRDRANAIEALWGVDTPAARDLLWRHVGDADNRVVGNAIFGLHILGDAKAIGVIESLTQRPQPQYRWTSAWLMARIGTEEHIEMLKQMTRDEDAGVRRSVLRALVGLKKEETWRQWEDAYRKLPAAAAGGGEEDLPETMIQPEPVVRTPAVDVLIPEINLRLDGSLSFPGF